MAAEILLYGIPIAAVVLALLVKACVHYGMREKHREGRTTTH